MGIVVTLAPIEAPPQRSLRNRALTAGLWTMGSQAFDLGVSLLSNLVMTRLLFPEAFGLVAAATAPIVGLALISDFGIHAVVVQSPRGEEEEFLRSAWTFQLTRGVLVWVALVGLCVLLTVPAIHRWLP